MVKAPGGGARVRKNDGDESSRIWEGPSRRAVHRRSKASGNGATVERESGGMNRWAV